MPDNEQKVTEKNYIKQYIGESGFTYDATNIRKKLAKEAYARYAEREENQNPLKYAEEEYIAAAYPKEKEEYLVEGAVLTCTMATTDTKKYRDKEYEVILPGKKTILCVTENIDASCCDNLHYATINDTKKVHNIPPFPCNCILAPYNDKEWEALEADESCLEEGTCKALMNLNEEWDNLPSEQTHMLFWNEGRRRTFPGITMSSILFCKHGGIITADESGQRMQEVLNSISSIAYENGEAWSEEQIDMAKYVTYRMILEGYSLEMIAGVVGNIVNEGKFGQFENSNYETHPEDKPLYLQHMDNVHNYITYVSKKNLFDVGTSILVQYRKEGNCTNVLHKFGLGMAQWTGERGETLIDRYLEKFGENAFPTKEECTEVEIGYMLEELRTTQHTVIVVCQEEAAGLSDSQAAAKNAETFMKEYEKPKENDSSKREEAAKIWYNILQGENDEK